MEDVRDPLQGHLRDLQRYVLDRPTSDSLYLSGAPTKYILTSSENHSSRQEKNISQSVEDIPERVNRLLLDVAILQHGGYLDNKKENWKLLSSLVGESSLVTRTTYNKYPSNEHDSPAFDLGFDIGLAFSTLIGHHSESQRASDFLAGLNAAFIDPHQPQQTRPLVESEESTPTQSSGVTAHEATLELYGIQPTDYLSGKIYTYSEPQEAEDHSDWTPKQATEEFVNKYLSEWFHKLVTLRNQIDEEWGSIEEADAPGMDVLEVLQPLWELEHHTQGGNRKTSKILAKMAGYKKSRHGTLVTQVLNRLSTDGKKSNQSKTTYEYEEIVRWDAGAEEWELSEYGSAMLYYVFEQDQNPEWIQEVGINRSPNRDGYYAGTGQAIVERAVKQYYEDREE